MKMVTRAKNIAFILADDFEDAEFEIPYNRLKEAGLNAVIVGLQAGKHLCGLHDRVCVTTEKSLDDVSIDDFDALVIAGGYSPDKLRAHEQAVNFARDFMNAGKIVGAICHGPQLLITADVLKGRTLTSWSTVAVDIENAGGNFVDKQVVVDECLVTSRNPQDAEAFSRKLIELIIGEERAAA